MGTTAVDEQVIEELVRRIVEAVHPLRIILFGSAARGEMGPHSDIDVMVVMPEGVDRLDTARFIYTQLGGIKAAVDVLVATPDDLQRYARTRGLVYHNVVREGRDVYVGSGVG
jgi:predicted nucleotidyltransferase